MEQHTQQPAPEPVDKRVVAAGAGAVLALLVVGWLVAFGANTPCVAAVSEARRLGDERVDPFAEDVIAAVRDGSLSAPACVVLSVRLRAFGKDGVHVERTTITQP
jgi:hypothetical protein